MAKWIDWPAGLSPGQARRRRGRRASGRRAGSAWPQSPEFAGDSNCATSTPSTCSAPDLTVTGPPLSVPVASSPATSSDSIRPASTWLAVSPARWIFEPSLPRISIDGMEILSAFSFFASSRSSSAGVSGVSSLTISSLLRLVLVNSTWAMAKESPSGDLKARLSIVTSPPRRRPARRTRQRRQQRRPRRKRRQAAGACARRTVEHHRHVKSPSVSGRPMRRKASQDRPGARRLATPGSRLIYEMGAAAARTPENVAKVVRPRSEPSPETTWAPAPSGGAGPCFALRNGMVSPMF